MSRVAAFSFFAGVLGFAGAGVRNTTTTPPSLCATPANNSTFSPDSFKPFKLISSRYESHDTRRFLFALGDPSESFSMPIASCIVAKHVDANGKDILRPYTPISSASTKGHFELLVKRYPNGKMGNHLFSMKPGDELLVKGPFEKFAYRANMWKHVGMLAGGTGITPMYQLIRGILENEKDKTEISLVYANKKREDILLANELVEFTKAFKNFSMYVMLQDIPQRWLGGIGFINRDVVATFMPAPQEKNTKVLVCGPPAMMKALVGSDPKQGSLSGLLHEMGYSADQVFKF